MDFHHILLIFFSEYILPAKTKKFGDCYKIICYNRIDSNKILLELDLDKSQMIIFVIGLATFPGFWYLQSFIFDISSIYLIFRGASF